MKLKLIILLSVLSVFSCYAQQGKGYYTCQEQMWNTVERYSADDGVDVSSFFYEAFGLGRFWAIYYKTDQNWAIVTGMDGTIFHKWILPLGIESLKYLENYPFENPPVKENDSYMSGSIYFAKVVDNEVVAEFDGGDLSKLDHGGEGQEEEFASFKMLFTRIFFATVESDL